jgi:hypothetical protein
VKTSVGEKGKCPLLAETYVDWWDLPHPGAVNPKQVGVTGGYYEKINNNFTIRYKDYGSEYNRDYTICSCDQVIYYGP